MATTWREFKYRIADRFFEYELDEAYTMGLREGARQALSATKLKLWHRSQGLTPARKEAFELAINYVDDYKKTWEKK